MKDQAKYVPLVQLGYDRISTVYRIIKDVMEDTNKTGMVDSDHELGVRIRCCKLNLTNVMDMTDQLGEALKAMDIPAKLYTFKRDGLVRNYYKVLGRESETTRYSMNWHIENFSLNVYDPNGEDVFRQAMSYNMGLMKGHVPSPWVYEKYFIK